MNMYQKIKTGLRLNLADILVERGLSQPKLARALSEKFENLPPGHPLYEERHKLTMKQPQISLLMRGHIYMRMIVLFQFLCEILGVSLSELISDDYQKTVWVNKMLKYKLDELPEVVVNYWQTIPFEERLEWSTQDIIDSFYTIYDLYIKDKEWGG